MAFRFSYAFGGKVGANRRMESKGLYEHQVASRKKKYSPHQLPSRSLVNQAYIEDLKHK